VGLAYVPIGDGEEEGGDKPDLAGEETASEESEEENRPDSESGGEHTAQEARCNGLGSEAKKHRVEVGKQSGIVEEMRIRVGCSQHSLRCADDVFFVRPQAVDVEPEIDGPEPQARGQEQQGDSPHSGSNPPLRC
jgi:hypothetical protein